MAAGNPIDIYPFANLNTTNSSASGNHAFLELATNDGNSNYNALLVSLRHRYTRGMAYGVSYTWSHNISDYVDNLTGGAFPQNSYDYAAERGDSMFDVRHHIVGYLTYELPVGKGKKYLGEGGVAGYILGWMAGKHHRHGADRNATIQLNAPDTSLSGGKHVSRPDCIGDARSGASDDPRTGFWLNPDAFAMPATGQFGNCGVGTISRTRLYQCGPQPVQDRSRSGRACAFEFRAEMFNAFNHANFSNPEFVFCAIHTGPGGFGAISSTIGDPREIQFGFKFYF